MFHQSFILKMRRLEFTKFRHKNPLYTPLHGGSLAVVSCDITLDVNKFLLKEGVRIVYKISRVIELEDYEVRLILSAGTYSTEQFNQNIKDIIKEKGNKLVAAQINDDYKLVIPEHHTFFSLKPFYSALGIKVAVALEKRKYKTNDKFILSWNK